MMQLSYARLALFAIVALAPSTVSLNPALSIRAHETAPSASNSVTVSLHPAPAAPGRVIARLPRSVAGAHFMYVKEGSCPDAIEVYKISGSTLTLIQAQSGGCASGGDHEGMHFLEAMTGNATHGPCLIQSNNGDGTINSYTRDAASGMLAGPVSSIQVGPGHAASPGDIVESKDGGWVYVFNFNAGVIDSLPVGAGCVLGSAILTSMGSGGSDCDITGGLLTKTQLIAGAWCAGKIITYAIGMDGTLTEVSSTPSAYRGPEGFVVITNNAGIRLYTGSDVDGTPMVQGDRVNPRTHALTPMTGSPASDTDSSAAGGAAIVQADAQGLLLQANTFSGQIGWFKSTSTNLGPFGGDTTLAQAAYPTNLEELGNVLFVGQLFLGDVEACAIASSGVSGCRSVATYRGSQGVGGSIEVV